MEPKQALQIIKSGKLTYKVYFDITSDLKTVAFAKATKGKSFNYLLNVKTLNISVGYCQYILDESEKDIYVFFHGWDSMDEFLYKKGETLFKENCFILKKISLAEFRELPIYLFESVEIAK